MTDEKSGAKALNGLGSETMMQGGARRAIGAVVGRPVSIPIDPALGAAE